MTISIGVTGHRILCEIDKIERGVGSALSHIETVYPGRALTVLSSLAEGSDRLVARCVLARPKANLVVPLPLRKEDYLQDFTTAESKVEFLDLLKKADEIIELSKATTRDAAYEAAGLYILDHCDVLLAVWDGTAEQGLGGTGGVVSEARRRKIPIAWVHAGNRKPGTLQPTSLGPEQGAVSFENL